MSKIRHIDFYPDEFLSGVDGMSAEQVGVYWLVCAKIYSRGDAIPDDDRENARIFRIDQRTWKRVKQELVAMGKLNTTGGRLINNRCVTELGRANKRTEDARNNALARWTSARLTPDDSPTVAPTAREPLPNHSQTVAANLDPGSSNNNGIDDAPAFSVAMLTNQLTNLPTNQEEDGASPPVVHSGQKRGKKATAYAFHGKVARLTQKGLEEWRALFPNIGGDLPRLLDERDGWLAKQDAAAQKNWFHSTKNWLANKNRDAAASTAARGRASGDGGINPSYPWYMQERDQWRARLTLYCRGREWFGDLWGDPPLSPGCFVPPDIIEEFRDKLSARAAQ